MQPDELHKLRFCTLLRFGNRLDERLASWHQAINDWRVNPSTTQPLPMGLAIEVGYLTDISANDEEGAQSFLEEIARLNTFLEASGLKAHQEPKDCPVLSFEMYGYSGLHYLRRIAAHLDLRGVLPDPGDKDPAEDPVMNEYYALVKQPPPSPLGRFFGRKVVRRTFDHLMLHSDAEGYYLPQDFAHVLFPPDDLAIPGGAVGSSPRLLAETKRLAEAIELPLDTDPESEEVWDAAENQGEGELKWKRYGRESFVCLRLHKAALHSVEHSAAIVFC